MFAQLVQCSALRALWAWRILAARKPLYPYGGASYLVALLSTEGIRVSGLMPSLPVELITIDNMNPLRIVVNTLLTESA